MDKVENEMPKDLKCGKGDNVLFGMEKMETVPTKQSFLLFIYLFIYL